MLKQILIKQILDRILDKDKPLGKTNVSTLSGGALGTYAFTLLEHPEPQMQALGAILIAASVYLVRYKESK